MIQFNPQWFVFPQLNAQPGPDMRHRTYHLNPNQMTTRVQCSSFGRYPATQSTPAHKFVRLAPKCETRADNRFLLRD